MINLNHYCCWRVKMVEDWYAYTQNACLHNVRVQFLAILSVREAVTWSWTHTTIHMHYGIETWSVRELADFCSSSYGSMGSPSHVMHTVSLTNAQHGNTTLVSGVEETSAFELRKHLSGHWDGQSGDNPLAEATVPFGRERLLQEVRRRSSRSCPDSLFKREFHSASSIHRRHGCTEWLHPGSLRLLQGTCQGYVTQQTVVVLLQALWKNVAHKATASFVRASKRSCGIQTRFLARYYERPHVQKG